MRRSGERLAIVFAATALGVMAGALVLPALGGIARSFEAGGPSTANYRTVLADRLFWRAAANNVIVPMGSLALEFAIGLAMALFLTSRRYPSRIVEAAAILPFAIPEIVGLSIARFVFTPRGYLNGAMAAVGIGPLPWLLPNHWLKLGTIMVADAWHVTPVVMLILMAGLRTIPQELYEAARLDGAGTTATFRNVTLPLLAPAIVAALMLRGVDALRIFSTTLVLTGPEGVPVISTYAYQLYSDAQEPNQAMAASVILAVLIATLSILGLTLSGERRAGGTR